MDTALSPKVEALYKAIDSLMTEDYDVNSLTVAQIASRAGIGKSTTYEYFDNKEELIGAAIVHKMSTICRKVINEMASKESVRDKIYLLFEAIDNNEKEKAVLLKIVNIVTATSQLSRRIEKIIAEHIGDMYMPERILDELIKQAEKEGYKTENKPASYIKLSISAKLIAYAIFSMMPAFKLECDSECMRRLVCEGIIDEIVR